jgi:hypothetical protein
MTLSLTAFSEMTLRRKPVRITTLIIVTFGIRKVVKMDILIFFLNISIEPVVSAVVMLNVIMCL